MTNRKLELMEFVARYFGYEDPDEFNFNDLSEDEEYELEAEYEIYCRDWERENNKTWQTGLFIEGTRSGYSPEQVERRTCTIRELIDLLGSFADESPEGEDTKVFLSNDRGYTYGEIYYDTFLGLGRYNEDGEVDFIEE